MFEKRYPKIGHTITQAELDDLEKYNYLLTDSENTHKFFWRLTKNGSKRATRLCIELLRRKECYLRHFTNPFRTTNPFLYRGHALMYLLERAPKIALREAIRILCSRDIGHPAIGAAIVVAFKMLQEKAAPYAVSILDREPSCYLQVYVLNCLREWDVSLAISYALKFISYDDVDDVEILYYKVLKLWSLGILKLEAPEEAVKAAKRLVYDIHLEVRELSTEILKELATC